MMKKSNYDRSTADQITIEVNNFDSFDNSNGHDFTSWDTVTNTVHPKTASSDSNVSVVQKPRLIKFKKNSREFREIVKIKANRQPPVVPTRIYKKRRMVQESPQLTTMQRVVSDVPEKENKLKRPGPFQAANKVLNTLSSAAGGTTKDGNSRWINQTKAAASSNRSSLNPTDSQVAATLSNGMTSSGVRCSYCSVTLTTQLEADLHIIAQHRHERACQREPLTCLEDGCAHSSSNLHGLKQHLAAEHQMTITSKFFTFQHMDEFTSWKKELEASCGSKFQFFSVFSEVTGGSTRLFVCNNEGRYDHHYAKLVRPRKHHDRKHQQQRRVGGAEESKCARACPAQLLVRSWGWGAIEVDATLFHYGHHGDKPGAAAQAESLQSNTTEQPAERLQSVRDGADQVGVSAKREDGVRIIEGSMLGQRGLDDLQTDLARWELVNNVSICACKRRDETDLQSLVQFEDFVLGFATSDQLEAWARHGGRAVCLDNAQIRISGGVSSLMEGQMTVCSVQVVTVTSHVLPIAWLLTSRYSDSLLKYFLTCLRVAYESFHSGPVIQPQFVMGETDSRFHKIWHEVFGGSSEPVLAARNTHKSWMAQLNSVIDPSKRQQVWKEMFSVVRDSNGPDDSPTALHDLLQRLTQDPDTEPFASYMMEQWLPQQRLEDSVLPPPSFPRTAKAGKFRDKSYNRGLYLDVLHTLYTFLYVDQEFSIDCDECVYKVQQFTANALQEAAEAASELNNSVSSKCSKRNSMDSLHSNTSTLLEESSSPTHQHPRLGSGGSRNSRLTSLTETRHRAACVLGPDSVASMGPHSWRVRSPNFPGENHVVKREAPKRSASQGSLRSICNAACAQVCRLCEVCVHQYTCTCPDSVILSVVCVHVHLIRVLMRNPQHVPQKPSAAANSNSSSTVVAGVNKCSTAHQSEEKIKTAIKQKCYSIISMLKTDNVIYANAKREGLSNRWETECLLQCDQQLESMINSLNNSRTSLTTPGAVTISTNYSDTEDNSSFPRSVLPENDPNSRDQDHACYVRDKTLVQSMNISNASSVTDAAASTHHDSERIKAPDDDDDALTNYQCNDNTGSSNMVDDLGAGSDELLVLQEENGRYRLVTGEHELLRGRVQAKNSILYGPMTPADPTTLLVHRTESARTSSLQSRASRNAQSGLR